MSVCISFLYLNTVTLFETADAFEIQWIS